MCQVNKYIVLLILLNIFLIVLSNVFIADGMWHQGKDGGFTARLYTTSIMSMLFYFLICDKYKFIYAIFGLIIGFVSILLSYTIIYIVLDLNVEDIFYYLLAMVIYISLIIPSFSRTLVARMFESKSR